MGDLLLNKTYSLLELNRRTFGGNNLQIAKVLTKRNCFIKDAPWAMANDKFNDHGVKWDKLPKPTHRLLNNGVDTTAGITKPLEERIVLIDDRSAADVAIIKVAPDKKQARINEAEMHLEGMSQQWAEDVIYGNSTEDPGNIDGVATRYNSLSLANVTSGGGSGSDLTSLWIFEWDLQRGVCFIYPNGSQTGIEHEDDGIQYVKGNNDKEMRAYVDYFALKFGLRNKDDRAVQRIANIETSGEANTLDIAKLITARNKLPMCGEDGGSTIYVNRTLKTQFDILAINKANAFYTAKDIWGSPVTMFQNSQVRLAEVILDTESAVG